MMIWNCFLLGSFIINQNISRQCQWMTMKMKVKYNRKHNLLVGYNYVDRKHCNIFHVSLIIYVSYIFFFFWHEIISTNANLFSHSSFESFFWFHLVTIYLYHPNSLLIFSSYMVPAYGINFRMLLDSSCFLNWLCTDFDYCSCTYARHSIVISKLCSFWNEASCVEDSWKEVMWIFVFFVYNVCWGRMLSCSNLIAVYCTYR